MTGIDWSKYPIIPDFDVLEWKAETQAAILRENEGKTDAEIRERLRSVGEWWEQERAKRRRETPL